MPTPGEHKTVQARILAYAQEIGWIPQSRDEADRRRGFNPQIAQIFTDSESTASHLRESAKSAVKNSSDWKALSLFFNPQEHYKILIAPTRRTHHEL